MAKGARPERLAQDTFNPFLDAYYWWFGNGSPVTLGIFRILLATVTFLSLLDTLFDFKDFYTDNGFAPVDIVYQYWLKLEPSFALGPNRRVTIPHMESFPRINLLSNVHSTPITLMFYLLVMVAAIFTALGLWTRISSICLAVGLVSLHHRDPLILHSGDTFMRICLIYLAVSPCGQACSFDRIIGLWKGKAPPEAPRVSLWPQRLIQYQVALVYFTTVWHKWFGTMWKDGTATFYPENLNEFNRFPVPRLVTHQPFVGFTTYGTLVVELSLATLVFYKPLRKYVIMAGIALHLYIEYRFNIPFFAFTIVAAYLCFYEGDEISAWAKGVGERLRRFRLLVELPAHQVLHPDSKKALTAMDPFNLVSYDTGSGAELSAVDLEGRRKHAILDSWAHSLGAWPLGVVPGLWKRLLKRACEQAPEEGTPTATNTISAS